MRIPLLLLAPLLLLGLTACSKGEGGNNSAAAGPPAPTPTGPPPRTPANNNVPVAGGNEANWMEPQDNSADPTSAPYENVLSQPVIKERGAN